MNKHPISLLSLYCHFDLVQQFQLYQDSTVNIILTNFFICNVILKNIKYILS